MKKLAFYLLGLLYKKIPSVYSMLYFCFKRIKDSERIRLIKKTVKLGDIVLDVGGNIGFYSVLLSRLVGETGKVYTFEPDPINFSLLKKNIRKFSNIIPHNLAAGKTTSKIKLYISSEINVDHQTYDSGENRNFIQVDCVKLDDFLSHLKKVNFIKIDVQGFDYYVLEGLRRIIADSDEIKILGEIWPYGLKKSGTGVNDYLNILNNLGLEVQFFDKNVKTELESRQDESTFYTDYWAFKKIN